MGAAEWLRHRLRDARPRPASVTRDAPAPLAPADDDSAPEEIPPLPQAVYIYFVDILPRGHAGRTASILTKTRLLWELGGQRSLIVTAYDSSQLDDISHDLRARGLLADGVTAASLHDFFPDPTELDPLDHHRPFEEPGLAAIADPQSGQHHFFRHGLHVLTKRLDYAGRPIVVDQFDGARNRTSSQDFWPNGAVRRTVFFDRFYQVARQELLHRRDGSVRLSIWWAVDPVTKVRTPERVTEFDLHGRPVRYLADYAEVIHACLDNLIAGRPAFLISEARRVDAWVLGYRRPNVRQIHVLHNAHLRPPYDDIHRIRPIYAPSLTGRNVDATVFLTQRQLDEARQHFGAELRGTVIPHSVPALPAVVPPVARDPKLVVMVARLDQQKQVDHAIDAFARVLRQVPDARLEIYGRGALTSQLQARIKRLGVSGSVTLAGFTDNPALAYRRAAVSLLTSKYEGFGLVLVESFQCGCPVVSYDLRYGPSDIITDGVDGYLVPPGDVAALAGAIVKVLEQPELAAAMSRAAIVAARRFSERAFVARWSALFNRLSPVAEPAAPDSVQQ